MADETRTQATDPWIVNEPDALEIDEVHPDGSIDVIVPGAESEVVRYVPESTPARVAVAPVRAGDVLVLEFGKRLSESAIDVVRRHVAEALGEALGVRVIILEDGMTLAGVLRRERGS